MATTQSHLSRLPMTGRLSDEALAFALTSLQRFLKGVKSATRAYEAGRVQMFVGDWRSDRAKAARIFAHMLVKATKVYHRSFNPYRHELGETIWDLKNDWDKLTTALDGKCGSEGDTRCDSPCRYFRCFEAATWQQTMANIILHLDETAEYETPDTHLMLLCYNRVKSHLVRQIAMIQQKNPGSKKFDEDRLVSVSDLESRMTCPLCMNFTEEILKPVRGGVRKTQAFSFAH